MDQKGVRFGSEGSKVWIRKRGWQGVGEDHGEDKKKNGMGRVKMGKIETCADKMEGGET